MISLLLLRLLGTAPGGRSELQRDAERFAGVSLVLTVIWAVTSRGYFWPEWPILVLGLRLAAEGAAVFAPERLPSVPPAFARQVGVSIAVALFFTLIWAFTSRGYFWPVWPMLVLAATLVVRGAGIVRGGGSQERITKLEETRAGAVEQQESELERIERDLHDGAQARLVALGMSLGMAEQKLASDPEGAQKLLAEARQGTLEALEELRSLARGIHPPVLADRGLAAAISALADRSPMRLDVAVDVPKRPPRAVETAAYFVVAEALANAGKHAQAQSVDISVRTEDDRLVIEIVDDGRGGADADGGGLRGLARRVEALDGTLDVVSPPGGGTTIRAVIPCES